MEHESHPIGSRLVLKTNQKIYGLEYGKEYRIGIQVDMKKYFQEGLNPDYFESLIEVFVLKRVEDETGVSGTGIIAEGVVFTDGTAVLRWVTKYKTTTVYNSIEDVENIHGHGGKTQIVRLLRFENEK